MEICILSPISFRELSPLHSVITNLQGSGVINRGIKEYGQTSSSLFVVVVFELPLFILFLLATRRWVFYGISLFIVLSLSLLLALIKTEKFRKCRANLWKNNRCCPKGRAADTIALLPAWKKRIYIYIHISKAGLPFPKDKHYFRW